MTEGGRCDKIKQQQLNKNKGGAAVINRFKESKLFFWSVELLVVQFHAIIYCFEN